MDLALFSPFFFLAAMVFSLFLLPPAVKVNEIIIIYLSPLIPASVEKPTIDYTSKTLSDRFSS
jgi:hypothetical protein